MYSRYTNPKELIKLYTKGRRFGKLVENVIASEADRRKQEAEKEEEGKLWLMYVHSMSGKSFNDWKKEVLRPSNSVKVKSDADLTETDMKDIINSLFSER